MLPVGLSTFNLAEFLLSTSIKGSVVLLLGWLAARLLIRASASVRYLVWSISFYGILWVMIGFWAMPRWHLDLLPPLQPESRMMMRHQEAGRWQEAPASAGANEGVLLSNPGNSATGGVQALSPIAPTDSSWRHPLLFLWLTGFLFIWVRFGFGVLRVSLLTKRAQAPNSDAWQEVVAQISGQFGLKTPLAVRLSHRELTPMTWGLLKPVVLLPKSAVDWSPERIRLVLIHEATHIQRKDFLLLVLSQFLLAIYWFNPLIWFGLRNLCREREHSCDDGVLSKGARASNYADHLLDIARSLKTGRDSVSSSLSMARVSELEGRLVSLLDHKVSRSKITTKTLLRAGLLSFAFLIPLPIMTPWGEAAPMDPYRAAWNSLPTGLLFPPEERIKLAKQNVSPDYVNRLIEFGYENPTVEQIISLKRMEIDPANIKKDQLAKPPKLIEVKYKRYVCMLADSIQERPTIAIKIDGQTYFGYPHCTVTLVKFPEYRYAYDPFSEKKVNKATAVLGVYPDNRVYYFETLENLNAFNRRHELTFLKKNQ